MNPSNDSRLPVTIVSGFADAGKTALVNHLLANSQGLRIAVVTDDEALVQTVGTIAAEQQFDYLLIEANGTAEPRAIAAAFIEEDEDGNVLADVARLDTLLTVVDSAAVLDDFDSVNTMFEGQSTVSELLVEQIEYANVLVLNKSDVVSDEQLHAVKTLMAALNPSAKHYVAEHGDMSVDQVLNTGLFDFEGVGELSGWAQVLSGQRQDMVDEFAVTSMVYERSIPFHPERFYDLIHDETTWQGVVRSRGYFWLATRHAGVGELSHAGKALYHSAAGSWWAEHYRFDDIFEQDPDAAEHLGAVWDDEYGDRRQELVFIGIGHDFPTLEAQLDACLLSEEEQQGGPRVWKALPDPFPEWSFAA